MKILYVNYLYDVTLSSVGAAVHVKELAEALSTLHYDVKVCFLNRFTGVEKSEKRTLRTLLKQYLGRYVSNLHALYSNIYYFLREWKLIMKERPDILLVRYNIFNFSIAIVCKILKIPFILEINSPMVYEKKVFRRSVIDMILIGWFLERLMIHFAATVYVVSNQLKQYYIERNIDSEKLHVIFNGVDETKISPSVSSKKVRMKYNLQGKKVLGFVGSFHYWHGIEQLQSLLMDILFNYDQTMFLLVGDGPLKQNMEDFIKEHRITDRVVLPGYVTYNDIPEYLSAMDIVLAPYPRHRIFYFSPIKLFEYMAAGKSVVASSIGQIKEIIEDGVNGMLFQAGNYKEMLEKSTLLLKNNSLRERIGKAARMTIEKNYTWKHTAEKLKHIIEQDIMGNKYGVM